jgi:hypothetical protein
MMRILLSLLLVLGTTGAASAQTAANSSNPYSATVPVAGTSDAQRNEAMSVALSDVLQQVSPGFAATPDVLAQASGYVRDFRYRRAASGGLELQVDFDPGAIGRMIARGQSSAVAAGQPGRAGSTGAPAVAAGGSGTLWVGGIDNTHAFASLLAVLRGDAALHDVIPVAASGDGVLVRLTSDQPLATVLAALTAPTGHLAPAVQPHPGADATLRWTP